MAGGYTIKSIDEFEEMEGSGNATWRLARKTLGAESFGFNVVDIAPGGQIPEHDHTGDNQEEVFVILDGQGTIVNDGEEHDAPAGTFCRYAPEVKRTIRNDSDENVRALLIGVPVDSGYEGMGWG
jgi:quercetin dioxygenase-like cupin family protein